MPRYVVRLRIRTRRPLTRGDLHAFDASRHDVTTRGKLGGHDLAVTLTVDSADLVAALSRGTNHVLDRVPGEPTRVEAAAQDT